MPAIHPRQFSQNTAPGTQSTRGPCCRPARLQITWLGYTGTTGMTAMDGLLADRFHVRPGEDAWYSERVLRMPHDYACYGPSPSAPGVGPLPASTNGFVTFGSFNNPAKY